MPIYEYRCLSCGKKTTIVTLSIKESFTPRCEFCQSLDVEKMVSRVSTPRSEESRLESLADPSKLSGLDENDPVGLARWMKKMGKEMGEEMGEDLDQAVEEAIEESERMKGKDQRTEGSEDL
jgi:putative FmdB family regulatory protein